MEKEYCTKCEVEIKGKGKYIHIDDGVLTICLLCNDCARDIQEQAIKQGSDQR